MYACAHVSGHFPNVTCEPNVVHSVNTYLGTPFDKSQSCIYSISPILIGSPQVAKTENSHMSMILLQSHNSHTNNTMRHKPQYHPAYKNLAKLL
uniref:Uncharacterized protein n=1 Tax=Kalanchoe fedtschenkoi TaxID=63787 RepID=A0A7N0T0C2_KALFE